MTLPVFAAYAGVILIWGTTWAAIRVGVETVPPFVFALERALAVGAILTLLSLALRLPFPRDLRTLLAAAVAGLFNIGLSWALVFWAEQFVPSGLVAVFGATAPVWTAFLAHFLVRGDRLSWLKVAALALGLVGTAVLVGSPIPGDSTSVLVATVLLALLPILWGVAAVLAARYLQQASPIPIIAIEVWAGALFLVPFALTQAGEPARWTGAAIVAFAYLVLLGSCVGLVLNLWLYAKLRPTTVMLSQVLIPVQAVLIGALALGEPVTPVMLAGALLVFAAVGLNALAGSGAPKDEEPLRGARRSGTAAYDNDVVSDRGMTVAIDPELNLFHSDPTLLERSEPGEYERAAGVLEALADPERLALLHALSVGERTAQRAAVWADLPQSAAERLLAAMTLAGVVERREGPQGPVYLPRDGHLVVQLHVALAHGREERRGERRQPRFLGQRRRRAVG